MWMEACRIAFRHHACFDDGSKDAFVIHAKATEFSEIFISLWVIPSAVLAIQHRCTFAITVNPKIRLQWGGKDVEPLCPHRCRVPFSVSWEGLENQCMPRAIGLGSLRCSSFDRDGRLCLWSGRWPCQHAFDRVPRGVISRRSRFGNFSQSRIRRRRGGPLLARATATHEQKPHREETSHRCGE